MTRRLQLYVRKLEDRALPAFLGPLPAAYNVPTPMWFQRLENGPAQSSDWIVRLNESSIANIRAVAETEQFFLDSAVPFDVVGGLGLPGQLLLRAPASVPENVARAELAANPHLAYFDNNGTVSANFLPNDPRFTDNSLYGLNKIDMPEAWDVATGSGVIVAVIDSGVMTTHEDLAPNIWVNASEVPGNGIDDDGNGFIDDLNGYDFVNDDANPADDNGHGTHVAGTIAAAGNNGLGVVGVAFSTKVMPLKFLSAGGFGADSDAIQCINYVTLMRTRGVNVVASNNSWGGSDYDQGIIDAIDAGGAAGVLFVAAAGNDGKNNDVSPTFPASFNSNVIISVGATDAGDFRASSSNFGADSVDLFAPGVNIWSTTLDGKYGYQSGTSMASPHVAGAAALLASKNPGFTVAQLRQNLLASVDPFAWLNGRSVTDGRLNVNQALRNVHIVTTIVDSGPGSIRQAVLDANANPGRDAIVFDSSLFSTPWTITLLGGELVLTDAVTISGPGAAMLTISGNKTGRIFNCDPAPFSSLFVIEDVTLSDGFVTGTGGAILAGDETLELNRCVLTGNIAGANGGAIGFQVSRGFLQVENSTITNNTAAGDGGGIYQISSGIAFVGSTLANNTAYDEGGGWFHTSFTNSSLLFRNSTIAANSAQTHGGGLRLLSTDHSLTIQNCTIRGNSAVISGGGIDRKSLTSSITVESSVIAGNSAPTGPDVMNNGTTFSAKSSAIGAAGGLTNYTDLGGNLPFGIDLKLSPFGFNGGNAKSSVPYLGSPLLNAGTNPSNLIKDSRGLYRVINSVIDIGAAEAQPTFVVRTNADSGPDSLRAVIADANLFPGVQSVTFDPAAFAGATTITLTSGELAVTDSVTIAGPTSGLTISGNNSSRVFNIGSGAAAALTGLTVTQGNSFAYQGGGIYSAGYLTLQRCVITGNTAYAGGGVFSAGDLSVSDCVFSGNTSSFTGGGLYIIGDWVNSATISSSTFSGNQSDNNGAGIQVVLRPTVTIANCTITGNSSGGSAGAGIRTAGNFQGTLNIKNSTVAFNNLTSASAVGSGLSRGNGTINILSCIIAKNVGGSGGDVAGPLNVNFSLIGATDGSTITGSNNITGTLANPSDPLLSDLAYNGGPTPTHLPRPDSPVIDAGSNSAGLTTDQRGTGFPREDGPAVDIGAVETSLLRVTNTNDAGPGSLRQAMLTANTTSRSEYVLFDPNVFASLQTITLTSGEILVSDSVTIFGPGSGMLTVSGNKASRVFRLNSPASTNVTISGLTFTGGVAATGGAIYSQGENLNITDCVLTGNSASGNGGAILIDGATLTLQRSTVNANTAASGGGLAVSGSVGIFDSTVSGNTATIGGALYAASGTTFISRSTLSGNSATQIGGALVQISGVALLDSSTLSGNISANTGGAIALYNFFTVLGVQNSTLTQNVAQSGVGGAIAVLSPFPPNPGGTIEIDSSIIAGNVNASAPDVYSPYAVVANSSAIGSSAGFTITGANNLPFGIDLKLGSLANNGGPTQTHALLPGSPLINAGSNPANLNFDQRGTGFTRFIGQTDIGAFEVQTVAAPAKVQSISINGGAVQRSNVTTIAITFDQNIGTPLASAIKLQNQKTLLEPTLNAAVDNTGSTTVVTLTFSGNSVDSKSLADGRYTLTINAGSINGGNFDGDDVNAGNNDYVLVGNPNNKLFRLFGDGDGNATVNAADFATFRSLFGLSGPSIFDFNNDGQTNAADFAQFRARFGLTLAP